MDKKFDGEYTLVDLPNKAVSTADGHQIKLHDRLYFRYAPGEPPVEYRVVSGQAVQYNGKYLVVVINGRGQVFGVDPLDYCSDPVKRTKRNK